MVAASVLSAVQNPKKLGGVLAIIFAVIFLIVGGTLLAVGLGKDSNGTGIITGGAVMLALAVIAGGVGLYFLLLKKKTTAQTLTTTGAELEPITAMKPSEYDATENQGVSGPMANSQSDDIFDSEGLPLPEGVDSSLKNVQNIYNDNPIFREAIAKGVKTIDKDDQLRRAIADAQKFMRENPGVAQAVKDAAKAIQTRVA